MLDASSVLYITALAVVLKYAFTHKKREIIQPSIPELENVPALEARDFDAAHFVTFQGKSAEGDFIQGQ